MAINDIQQNIIVSVRTDTSQAQEGVEQLGTQLGKLGKTDVGTGSVQSLKAAIREANNEAQIILRNTSATSAEYVAAAKKVAELKEQFRQYTQTVAAFNPANKLAALTGVARGATGSIEGVAGAMAFLGGESSKNEEIIRRLHGLMLFADALEKINVIKNSFKNLGLLLGITTKAQKALNTEQQAGAVATEGQTVAIEAQTVATEGATVASKVLGTAMKAIPLLAIAAVVIYLISKWDDLTESVTNLIPGLKGAGEWFGKIVDVAKGVGAALVKYIVGPIKAIAKAVTGDFKGAVDELKNGMNVIGNFTKEYKADQEQRLVEHNNKILEVTNEGIERQIEAAKKGGKDTYQLEKELAANKLVLAESNAQRLLKNGKELSAAEIADLSESQKKKYDEYLKAKNGIEDVEQEHGKKMDEERKKRNEKIAEDRKKQQEALKEEQEKYKTLTEQLTDYYKGVEDIEAKESEKLNEKNTSEREAEINKAKENTDSELRNLEDKYQKERDKLDEALQNKVITQSTYNDILQDMIGENAKAINLITENEKKSELDINKKYNDKVVEYLNEVNAKQISSYEEKRVEVRKKAEEIKKDATDIQKALVDLSTDKQIADIDKEETLHKNTISSQTNLVNTQTKNTVTSDDNPDEKAKKEQAVYKAEIAAENAAYAEKLNSLKGNQSEIEELTAQHQNKLTQLAQTQADQEKAIEASKVQIITSGLNTLENVVGKKTVAGKAMAVAAALINTYQGVTKDLAEGGVWGIAQGAITLAAGIASVTKILNTKIPNQSEGGMPSISAPTLDSSHLQPQAQTQNVNVVNQSQKPIQATITQKELTDNEQRTSFVNNLRSF